VFSADVYILAPRDQSRGNGVALFDVVNRGNKTLLARFNHAAQSVDPKTEADFGDGFLMQRGYTLIAVGWQLDVPKRSGVLGVDAPRIAVSGRVSTLFTPNASGQPTNWKRMVITRCASIRLPTRRAAITNSRCVRGFSARLG